MEGIGSLVSLITCRGSRIKCPGCRRLVPNAAHKRPNPTPRAVEIPSPIQPQRHPSSPVKHLLPLFSAEGVKGGKIWGIRSVYIPFGKDLGLFRSQHFVSRICGFPFCNTPVIYSLVLVKAYPPKGLIHSMIFSALLFRKKVSALAEFINPFAHWKKEKKGVPCGIILPGSNKDYWVQISWHARKTILYSKKFARGYF